MEPDQPYSRTTVEEEAIAAAEVVACWLGHPPPQRLRAGLAEWARQHLAITPEIVSLARQAVAIIKMQSSLKALWTDRDGAVRSEWLASIEDLERRLAS